ncbi:DivIVA domain-containing protein [Ornithinimicrobium pekingense]|uniref:Cell wall synthesis protein Wag31 n=1 Tax=Ornithinimicrobium pekingense TaxID=384677 RepID=A0ABQ2F803_9MICO|nr:DivIVA domain-containing protein [Ornithinimicrobium pekingense]GGK68702.1 hypothetical protein GCM10011509_16400 [Ornithinimicrobium pekingense]
MPLLPEDVVRKSFRSANYLKRGYEETEVDSFLEEVVVELRRLHAEVDELKAARLRPLSLQQLDEEQESERVVRERQQLELIRTERRELVAELAAYQTRLDNARADIESADARVADADRAATEAGERQQQAEAAEAEASRRLQRLTHEHDVLLGSHETLVQELRTLRLTAETQATEVLGQHDLFTTGTDDTGQVDDLKVIATIAAELHDHFVEQGRAEGERLSVGARTEAERLQAEAAAEKEQATASAQRILATAHQQAREMTDAATVEKERLVQASQAERDRLIADAEAERAGILADLQARRAVLERRIVELDEQQGAYRDRLRALVQQQLASLDDEEWRLGATTGSEAHAPALP